LARHRFAIDALEELPDEPNLRARGGAGRGSTAHQINTDIPLFLALRAVRR
jgi:hypothetical protein